MTEKRKSPFTSVEKELLTEIVAGYLGMIESKKTDAVYNKQKLEAGSLAITAKFNSSVLVSQEATSQQLRKLWLNMKTRARDVKTAARQRMHTDGGPYIEDPPPEDDMLGDVISGIKIMLSIKVIKDREGMGDDDEDEDDEWWQPKIKKLKKPERITNTDDVDLEMEMENKGKKQYEIKNQNIANETKIDEPANLQKNKIDIQSKPTDQKKKKPQKKHLSLMP